MDAIMSRFYFNPRYGLSSQKDLYNTLRENGYLVSMKQVKEFFDKQKVNQVFKRPKNVYIPVKCNMNTIGCLQGDLLDIRLFKKKSQGFKYILNVIDVASRYLWSIPVKSKNGKDVSEALTKIVEEFYDIHSRDYGIILSTDMGNEFLNSDVKRLLNEYDIEHKVSLNKGNTSIVERIHQTLWGKLKKYTETYKNMNIIEPLQAMVEKYNNTYHPTVRIKPKKGFQFPYLIPDDLRMKPKNLKKYEIGDKVRYLLDTELFEKKSYTNKFSRIVYYIVGKIGYRYKLSKDKDDEPIDKTYLSRELMEVKESVEPSLNEQQQVNVSNDDVNLQIVRVMNKKQRLKNITKVSNTQQKSITPLSEKRRK